VNGQGVEEKGWCVLELMGHRKLAGYVSDDDGLLRIDVYDQDPELEPEEAAERDFQRVKPVATQWYGRQAIYCITATTKDLCVRYAKGLRIEPIGRWELPEQATSESQRELFESDADDVTDDDEMYQGDMGAGLG
jgi:hypothetical protein